MFQIDFAGQLNLVDGIHTEHHRSEMFQTTYSNDLPEKSHDQMRNSFGNILRMNIDHFASDATRRIDRYRRRGPSTPLWRNDTLYLVRDFHSDERYLVWKGSDWSRAHRSSSEQLCWSVYCRETSLDHEHSIATSAYQRRIPSWQRL